MIVYVDLEHPELEKIDKSLWCKSRTAVLRNKYSFEQLSGHPCLIMHYAAVSPAALQAVDAAAVLVSGCYLEFSYYAPESLEGLRGVYREWERPLIGFCGGMQLLAQTFGAAVDAMDPVPIPIDERPHLILEENQSVTQELGFQEVQIQNPHPLLAGVGDTAVLFQAHYWEVKWVPAQFRLLASSDLCRVQAIAHERRPLFGTQPHLELFDASHPDGRVILENFFRMID